MLKAIAVRILSTLLLLLAVAAGAFLLVRIAPGNFLSDVSTEPQISAATWARLQTELGVNTPWYAQFGKWLAGVMRGDFGQSFACNCPASSLVSERILATIELALSGLLMTLLIALPLGWLAARTHGGWLDRILLTTSAALLATPTFLLALVALVWAAQTGWFPLGGTQSLDAANWTFIKRNLDILHHLFLPAAVLALRHAPAFFRQWRVSLLETVKADFILTARAKGLNENLIWLKHAGRHALHPLLTMLGQTLGALLSGAFIVEAVMSWPGLGGLAVSALFSRDLNVLVACLLCAAFLLTIGNLLADLLLQVADPRLRTTLRV